MTLMGLWLLYIIKGSGSSLGETVTVVLYCPKDKLRLASNTILNGEDDEGKEVGCEARRGKAIMRRHPA